MKRFSPLFAAIAVTVSLALPAFASASPVNLTNWDPGRASLDRAGKWQSVAVNPKNGNQLVAMAQYETYAQTYYSVGVWDANGAPVGPLVDAVSPPETNGSYTTPVGAYNPKTGGWLLVYWDEDVDEYVTRLLNPNGSLSGSAHIISAAPDTCCGHNPDIVWDSAKQQFFVAWSDYGNSSGGAGQPQGRFVNPSTGAAVGSAPIDLVTNQADFVWDDYHSMQAAYSSKQDGFGVMFRGLLQSGGVWRPYFLRLNSNGQPIGTPQVISSGSDLEVGNGSIAYSKASNRYAVAWSDYQESGNPVNVQLFNAATGADIGAPVAQPLPVDIGTSRQRIQISADEFGDGYAIVSYSDNTTEGTAQTFGLWLDSDAQPVGTPAWVSSDLTDVIRPQIAFDAHSGCFRVSQASFDAGGTYADVYSFLIGTRGPSDCSTPPSGKKPTLKKSGTAGSTSLRVKVGCGGTSACRVKLSGKLKGGSGKLQGKTVKVKAGKKKTVTLDYSDPLISELVGRSGSKIKVTAKQVGGKSRTITVAVPDSVTG